MIVLSDVVTTWPTEVLAALAMVTPYIAVFGAGTIFGAIWERLTRRIYEAERRAQEAEEQL